MKKAKAIIIILLLLFQTSCGKTDNQSPTTNITKNTETEKGIQIFTETAKGQVGDSSPISRAEVAKMLALTFSNTGDISTKSPTIKFKDLDPASWYYNYVNMAANLNIIKGDGVNFRPTDNLTIEEAQFVLDNINTQNPIKLDFDNSTKNSPISYALWVSMYQKTLDDIRGKQSLLDKFGIVFDDETVLGTASQNGALGKNNTITDMGLMKSEGLNLSVFLDKSISVYKKNNEIILVSQIATITPTIKSAYIQNYDGKTISIYVGGITRKYNVAKGKKQNIVGNLCDITIGEGSAKAITVFSKSVTDTVKACDMSSINLDKNGDIKISDGCKFYSFATGQIKAKSSSDLKVGNNNSQFILSKNQIVGVILGKEDMPERIRVAIYTTGFESLVHKEVVLTCDTAFTIEGDSHSKKYDAGQVVTINATTNDDLFDGKKITAIPTGKGKIELKSVQRNWGDGKSPQYHGTMDIIKQNDGYSVVNDVSISEYLYGVVPSEMPSSYGLEASKVQAVAARSYAYNQVTNGSVSNFGANVDDSVSFQVYNNTPENDISIQAVNDTKGQCITYKNKVINAYFFSTSGGTTANSGEVWNGGDTPVYLTSQPQYNSGNFGDLTQEANADAFFKNMEVDAYEKNDQWFRWSVTMTNEEISTSINKNLSAICNATPQDILTKSGDGTFKPIPISSVGLVTDIKVLKRGIGGNIIEMEVDGTDNTIEILSEYNIRSLLRPYQYIAKNSPITIKTNGKNITNLKMMPSAFFAMDITYDDLKHLSSVKFNGGGNGHGVGMSQTGAYEMTKAGLTYEDIIKHYYTQCDITKEF